MKIDIYTICWNEEHMLPYYFDHYKKCFPNANFIVYDNMSSDSTKEIIEKNGGKIIPFDTNEKVSDDLLLEIKNNCWKNSKADWVLVSDVDEFIYCDTAHLQSTEATFIKPEGYEMVGDTENPNSIMKGVRNYKMDKVVLFKPQKIDEINYSIGAHYCNPKGVLIKESKRIILQHFKYISADFVINRYAQCANRLSEINIKNDWGVHYKQNAVATRNVHAWLTNISGDIPLSPLRLKLYNKLYVLEYKYKIFKNLKKFGITKPFV